MTSQDAEQMIVDNQKLVHYAIRKFFPTFYGDEDITQIGLIGLWKACTSYDESKSKFSTYAIRCICNEIKLEFRYREKLQKIGDVLSLYEPIRFNSEHSDRMLLVDVIADRDNAYTALEYDLSALREKISERNLTIFRMWMYGYTSKEISEHFHLSQGRIEVVLKNVRELIKSAFR